MNRKQWLEKLLPQMRGNPSLMFYGQNEEGKIESGFLEEYERQNKVVIYKNRECVK